MKKRIDVPTKSMTVAAKWLEEQGFRCSKDKFRLDKNKGLIGTQSDGSFSPESLLQYGEKYLRRAVALSDVEAKDAARRKIIADADMRSAMAKRARLKLEADQGRLMPRVDHELELAARAQFFRRQVEVFCNLAAPRILACVCGDDAKLPDLVQLLMEETSVWLDAYAAEKSFVVEGMGNG